MGGVTEVKPFWLVSSFEYENINELDGDVQFKIFTKWWWHSKEELETDKNDGGGGFFKNEVESAYFPVNPSLPFLNLVMIENIDQLAWAKSTALKEPTDVGYTFLNSAQKVYRAKLRSKLVMKRYPFDRHLVCAILGVRRWHDKGDTHKWQLLNARPDKWFNPGHKVYEEDNSTISLLKSHTDKFDELKTVFQPEVRMKGKKPVLCLKLERDPSSFFFNVAFPTFITVSIVLMSCYNSEGVNIESVATGILTLVASQLALQEKLPKKVYLTYAGIYLLSAYTFLFGLGIALTIIERYDLNVMDDHEAAFWIVLVFAVNWAAIHFVMLLDEVFFRKRYFSEFFREPWDKILIPVEPKFECGKNYSVEIKGI
jgi:hypothetical protein